MLWENVALRRKYKNIVPVDPFVIHRVPIKGTDMVKDIAQLPKGVDPKKYGDLLAGYEVKKFCVLLLPNLPSQYNLDHCIMCVFVGAPKPIRRVQISQLVHYLG